MFAPLHGITLPFLRKMANLSLFIPYPNFALQALDIAAGVCPVQGQGREDRRYCILVYSLYTFSSTRISLTTSNLSQMGLGVDQA